jgi:hypothetical protein
MPTCRRCNVVFGNSILVDGIRKNVQNRMFCVECSPYGKHNTRDLTRDESKSRCCKCGETLPRASFYTRPGTKYPTSACKKCLTKCRVDELRKPKKLAVAYKGGKCSMCGYSRCIDALEFHHLDPERKDFSFSEYGRRINNGCLRKDVLDELDKCILLCANCHRERHFYAGWSETTDAF